MQKRVSSHAHVIGLGLSLILLALVAVGSRLSWTEYESAADATRRARANIDLLKNLLIRLGDAETGQRGIPAHRGSAVSPALYAGGASD